MGFRINEKEEIIINKLCLILGIEKKKDFLSRIINLHYDELNPNAIEELFLEKEIQSIRQQEDRLAERKLAILKKIKGDKDGEMSILDK